MSAVARESEASRLNVLVVEDSEDDAELIALELKRGGLNPVYRRVENAAAMRRALEEAPWDLVVSDYSMPDFSLPAALEMVRSQGLDVPFVIVSATIGEEAAVAAMKAGAHDYILKHRLGRLVPAVRRELRECAVRRERKQLEEQLRQAQKLESIGLLAGGVAHDFNNLLTGIMGNATLAMDILNPEEPARSMLQDVINASERAADLTRQLLAYAGKGNFVIEPIRVSELVQSVSELIRSTTGRGIELHFDLGEDAPTVEADRGQVQQIVMNLLINAVEAIGGEAGSIAVRTFGLQVRPGESRSCCFPQAPGPGLYACIQVSDNGSGIQAKMIPEIFDPFFTTKFTGRGLGLAAVLGVVRRQHGAIQVQSAEGRGSTFTVLLPASMDTPVMTAAEPPPAGCELAGTGMVLVADDEEIVRHAARSALEHYGYTVFEAKDGQDAVDLYGRLRDRIAVVLLDLTMPNMNGQQAFEQMRRLRRDVKVLVSSGFDEDEARRRFPPGEPIAFIQKPYTAADLAERIKAVMAGG